MAKLSEADAALRQAEADVQKAVAAVKQAKADKIAAETEAQKILNEYNKAKNEAELDQKKAEIAQKIAEIERQMELDEIAHAAAVAAAEAEYEKAMTNLKREMRDFRLAAKDLTPTEKQMLISSAAAYVAAQQAAAEQVFVVMQKEQDLKEIETKIELFKANAEPGTIFETEVEKDAKLAELKDAIKDLEAEVASVEDVKSKAKKTNMTTVYPWTAAIDQHERNIQEMEAQKSQLIGDVAVYYQATVHDAVTRIQKEIENWMTLNPKDTTDEFKAALENFVGTTYDEKTKKYVVNIEYDALKSWLPVKEFKGNQTEEIIAYMTELAQKFYEVDKLGDFQGVKAGTLYSYAAGCFNYTLTYTLEGWQNRNYDDRIRHEEILLEGAQAAALAVAQANKFVEEFGEVTIDSENYTDWAELVEAFNKAKEEYVAELGKQIEELNDAIDELKAQKKAVKNNDITFYFEMEFARAYASLEKAKQVQAYLEKAADQLSSIYHNVYAAVSENYEGIIDFSTLIDADTLKDLLTGAEGGLKGVLDSFMDMLNSL